MRQTTHLRERRLLCPPSAKDQPLGQAAPGASPTSKEPPPAGDFLQPSAKRARRPRAYPTPPRNSTVPQEAADAIE